MSTKPATPASATKPSKARAKPAAKTEIAAVTKVKPMTLKSKVVKAMPAKKPVATKIKPVAEDKTKKVKLVRDSFTMPKNEYQHIESLKLSLAKQGRPAKKSELLRAGLMLLSKQTPGALLACVDALAPVKTGRPKKS